MCSAPTETYAALRCWAAVEVVLVVVPRLAQALALVLTLERRPAVVVASATTRFHSERHNRNRRRAGAVRSARRVKHC